MASGDSGNSPSNAAMERGGNGQDEWTYKVLLESPRLELHISSYSIC